MLLFPKIEIIVFTNPVCPWCWGSEAIIRKIKYRYGKQIKFSYIMGDLGDHININDVGLDFSKYNNKMKKLWLEASKYHHMPVYNSSINYFTDHYSSIYSLNIAHKAAQLQSEKLAELFLRRIREATIVEGRFTNQMENLLQLAQEVGLDIESLNKSITEGCAVKLYKEDLKIIKSFHISTFPSFLIRNELGDSMIVRGYQDYETFREIINYLTNNEVTETIHEANDYNINQFIKYFKRVVPVEISLAFDMLINDVHERLIWMENHHQIQITNVGNGFYIDWKDDVLVCDPQTGICYT